MPITAREMGVPVLLAALVLASGGPAAAAGDAAPAGQATYEQYCAACHGFDGVPILPASPNFAKGERMDKSDAELLKTVREGKDDVMPPWGQVLSERQRADVLRYIRGFAGEREARQQ